MKSYLGRWAVLAAGLSLAVIAMPHGAAAHHGHAFGSLVLIDPQVPDDGAMSQLSRLTPDAPFPESAWIS